MRVPISHAPGCARRRRQPGESARTDDSAPPDRSRSLARTPSASGSGPAVRSSSGSGRPATTARDRAARPRPCAGIHCACSGIQRIASGRAVHGVLVPGQLDAGQARAEHHDGRVVHAQQRGGPQAVRDAPAPQVLAQVTLIDLGARRITGRCARSPARRCRAAHSIARLRPAGPRPIRTRGDACCSLAVSLVARHVAGLRRILDSPFDTKMAKSPGRYQIASLTMKLNALRDFLAVAERGGVRARPATWGWRSRRFPQHRGTGKGTGRGAVRAPRQACSSRGSDRLPAPRHRHPP